MGTSAFVVLSLVAVRAPSLCLVYEMTVGILEPLMLNHNEPVFSAAISI